MNSKIVFGLEPAKVLEAFVLISKIDRGSGREVNLAAEIVAQALRHDYVVQWDVDNNVVVYMEATPDCLESKSLCLQSHLDMVPVGQDGADFDTGTIEFVVEDGKLRANNTTLGADNGIGVAMMIALMDHQFSHGPLELLFTSDEERGLNGAMSLNPEWISSRWLVNLDSEELGEITLGCAGGGRAKIRIPMNLVPAESISEEEFICPQFTIKISGLVGGHSGADINKKRANAIVSLGQVLRELINKIPLLRITSIEGGGVFNRIPTQSQATLVLPFLPLPWEEIHNIIEEDIKSIVEKVNTWAALNFSEENSSIIAVSKPQEVKVSGFYPKEFSNKLLQLLYKLPNGVIAYDKQDHSVVETSNNIATICREGDRLVVETMYRSSSVAGLYDAKTKIMECAFNIFSWYPEIHNEYPAWQPRYDSELLRLAEGCYDAVPKRAVIHGGLECAYFADKWPGIQMISIGPNIRNPHSQNEYVELDTIAPLYEWLLRIISNVK